MSIYPGFISYAHDNHSEFETIYGLLKQLKRNYGFDFWGDVRLKAGDHWNDEIARRIEDAKVFALIVSGKFFESDYIFDKELPAIRDQRINRNALVLPIVLEPCGFEAFVGGLQPVPCGEKANTRRVVPITKWKPTKAGYNAMREQIEDSLCCWFQPKRIEHI